MRVLVLMLACCLTVSVVTSQTVSSSDRETRLAAREAQLAIREAQAAHREAVALEREKTAAFREAGAVLREEGAELREAQAEDREALAELRERGGVLHSQEISGGLEEQDPSEYRLPEDVTPVHYDVTVLPRLTEQDNFTFTGKVAILVKIHNDTDFITLHSKGLAIPSEEVLVMRDYSSSRGRTPQTYVNVDSVSYKKDADFLIIHLQETLKQGHMYKMSLTFSGFVDESLSGFYRSSYKDKSGKKQWLGVTQFEPTYARQAFPCFDEPEFKATFSITVGRPQHLTAISNMPLNKTEPIPNMDGWVWDKFGKSVPMSTYLVAYVVSPFTHVKSNNTETNVNFRIWARDSAIDQVAYAAEAGPKVLAFYEKYFDLPFPLPKQDMVAVPDFSAGAMENWGLITYRETALLYSPHSSSSASKFRVAEVVAHELAHQWFGNLVTMKWWTDLWLNEGFATYVAFLGINHLEPEWNTLEEEAADTLADVFKLDALSNSHPVSVPIGNPKDINQIFDTISYKKGGSLLRMMNLFLGEEVFRAGIRSYLKKYQYANAEQDDLWESLTEAAHKYEVLTEDMTVKQIMDNWTKQTGYPLLTVTRDYQHNTADVKQERYTGMSSSSAASSNTTWWVPVTYLGGDRPSITPSREWLKPESHEQSQQLPAPPRRHWLLYNIHMAGLYRVNYDAQNWDLLIQALNSPKYTDIPTLNRYQLILDSLDLAWAAKTEYNVAFRVLQYLSRERSYLPWRGALNSLNRMNRAMKRSSDYGAFKAYMRSVLQPAFEANGGLHNMSIATPDRYDAVKHQVLISNWACRVDVVECREHALKLFNTWVHQEDNKANEIPRDLRRDVYCVGVSAGGQKEWDIVWRRYLASQVASEKVILLRSLGCTKEIWLLNRFLSWSIQEGSGIRPQDSQSVFDSVCSTEVGFYPAKSFLYQRTEDIYKHQSPHNFGKYAKAVASHISTQDELNEFSAWARRSKKYLAESFMTVKRALENTELTLNWIRSHQKGVVKELIKLTPAE